MRPKLLILSIVLFLAAFLLIFLNLKGGIKPARSLAEQAPRPFLYVFSVTGKVFSNFFNYFGSVRKLNKQNALLSAEVLRLKQENISLEQYKVENEILKKELDFRSSSSEEFISGIVISSDPTGFSQSIVLNIGSNQGVKVGSAVLSEGVFIGTVIAADTFTSRVLLITDPQSAVQAEIAGTSDSGIVRGSGGSGIVLDMLAQNTEIKKNDPVVTFGSGTEIPPGILIGTVGEVQSLKNDLLQKASVISGVNLKKIKFAAVLKK